MTWYIIRHADKEAGSFYNARLRHSDPPLSAKGRLEAQKLTAYFSEKRVAAIYVSAYQRTLQTIQEVASQHNLTPIVDDRLNEIDNGIIEGLTDPELQQEFPDTWKAFIERKTDFRFPEGETGTEAQQRMINFFAEKLPAHGEADIILVSHDGLIRALMCYLMDIPVFKRWNFQIDLCGIVEITYQPAYRAWKLVRFNQKLVMFD
jgi:broad specificity phosphatase PhoE